MADTQDVMNQVAATLQNSSNVKVVFGEPMSFPDGTGDEVVVIPVAKSFVMGGGGNGRGRPGLEGEPESGMGTGIVSRATPLGYIKVADGDAEFVEIVDMSGIIMKGIFVGGFVVYMLTKLLKKIYG
jgi:uncharacterized spore protein YtfJ